MEALRSPFENDQLPRRWYFRIFAPWSRYLRALQQQVRERGAVPEDVWCDPERKAIAKRIEKLICEECWGEYFEFHPDDPWKVVGEWEVGDLSEAELLMEMEDTFKIKLPEDKEMGRLIAQGWTFGDMVAYVQQNASQPQAV